MSVCMSVCPRTRQCIGSIKKLAQPLQQHQQRHWFDGSSQCCCCCVVVGNPSVTLQDGTDCCLLHRLPLSLCLLLKTSAFYFSNILVNFVFRFLFCKKIILDDCYFTNCILLDYSRICCYKFQTPIISTVDLWQN